MKGRIALVAALCFGCGAPRSQLRKAEGYLADGRSGAAVRAYEKVLERKPGMPEALLGISRAWIADDKPEQAIVPAQVASELGQEGAREALGQALILTGRGADAVAPLQGARKDEKKPSADLLLLLAEATLASGDVAGATGIAEEALQNGGGAAAQATAAWLHARGGNCERGLSLAARSLTTALSEPEVQAEAAAVFRLCGDAERAKGAASAARTLQAAGREPWQREAARFSKGGDNEGAARRLSRLRAVWPEDGHVAMDLGSVWAALNENARAAFELDQSLRLAPLAAGQSTGGVQVVNRSADHMDKAQRDAAWRDVQLRLAKVRGNLGDLEGAAKALEAVARQEVDDAEQWVEAAQAWLRAGKADEAAKAAVAAVSLKPRSAPMQALASTVYGRAGDVARAVGHGRMAWELEPGNADYALNLTDLYRQRGETREARRVLEETLSRGSTDPRLRAALQKLDPAP